MSCKVVSKALLLCTLAACFCAAQSGRTADALSALQQGNLSAAEQLLRAELRTQPKDPQVLEILAIVLDQQKRLAEADAVYRRALPLDPHSPSLLNNFGNHLIASGKRQEARAVFLRVLSIDPSHVNACLQLAQISLNQHSPSEAIGFLDRLPYGEQGRVDVRILRGEALTFEGHYREAKSVFLQALDAAPQNASILRDLAGVQMKMEQFPDAADTWKRYLALAPDDEVARRECAFAETAIGSNNSSALAGLRSFVRDHPNDAAGYYELGAAESADSPDKALAHLNRAIELEPFLLAARLARGLLLYRQSKPVEALTDFQTVAKRQPDDARALDRLGQTYTALNRFRDAVPVLRKAAAITPDDSSVLLHLGLALAKTGNPDESKLVFARMRQLEAKTESPRN